MQALNMTQEKVKTHLDEDAENSKPKIQNLIWKPKQ